MREFIKRTRLTQDMKKAIQRNVKLDENFSVIERQLDKEKLMTLNQLSERKREFIRERAKRRLSLPNIETTGTRSVSFGRQKAPSTDEGKDAPIWRQFSDRLNFHPRSLSPSNKQDPELIIVSSLGSVKKKSHSDKFSNDIYDAPFTDENNVCRLPRLKDEGENEHVRAQLQSFKPRRISIVAPSASLHISKRLGRRATLPTL